MTAGTTPWPESHDQRGQGEGRLAKGPGAADRSSALERSQRGPGYRPTFGSEGAPETFWRRPERGGEQGWREEKAGPQHGQEAGGGENALSGESCKHTVGRRKVGIKVWKGRQVDRRMEEAQLRVAGQQDVPEVSGAHGES